MNLRSPGVNFGKLVVSAMFAVDSFEAGEFDVHTSLE
jgi:hypothetical protein